MPKSPFLAYSNNNNHNNDDDDDDDDDNGLFTAYPFTIQMALHM